MIAAERAHYPVRLMCRVLGVSPSAFYASLSRPPSKRTQANEQLKPVIREVFLESRATYGSPRVHFELQDQGHAVGRHRVARLMRAMDLTARIRRRKRRTEYAEHDLPVAENLLDRRFEVRTPDSVWATDITYIWTREGWLYLAVVMDLFSRRIVGWSMADHMRTELVRGALEMACGHRVPAEEMLHHSDRGSQYASWEYQQVLKDRGIECSMSRKAECYDHAVVESFFGTLKQELVYRTSWITRREARHAIHDYIEVFYNRRRRHSYLGNLSPVEFEKLHPATNVA